MAKEQTKNYIRTKIYPNGNKEVTAQGTVEALDKIIDDADTDAIKQNITELGSKVGELEDGLYIEGDAISISKVSCGGYICAKGDSRNPFPTGMWLTGSNYTMSLTNISQLAGKRISVESVEGVAMIAFLKDNYFANGKQPHFCEGQIDKIDVERTASFVVPNDCNYIAVVTKWAGSVVTSKISQYDNFTKVISSKIGDLSNLQTENKQSIVSAINELTSKEVDAYSKTQSDARYAKITDVQGETDCSNRILEWEAQSSNIVIESQGNKSAKITVNSKLNARVYLDLGDIPVGTKLRITWEYDINGSKTASFQALGSISNKSDVWTNLEDDNGDFVKSDNGVIDFYYTVNKRYILFSGYQYNEGDKITISNFRAVQLSSLKDDIQRLGEEVSRVEEKTRYSQNISSSIPNWDVAGKGISLIMHDDKNITATVVNKSTATRVYLDFEQIKNDSRVRLSFNYSINGLSVTLPPLGSGGDPTGGWANLTDENGIAVRGSNGKVDAVIRKQAQYIFFAAAQYNNNDVIDISNVSIQILDDIESLTKSVNAIDAYKHGISSYLNINSYSHERLMTLNNEQVPASAQGSAVHDDYFFQCYNGGKIMSIYNLSTKSFVQNITIDGIDNSRTHANTATFGNKYVGTDRFPLLYVCSGYAPTTTSTEYQVYVIRFVENEGTFSANIIQTITIDFGIANGWVEAVVDADNNRLWVKSNVTHWDCVALPPVNQTSYKIDKATEKIYSFVLPPWNFSTGKSSNQGHIFYKGRIIMSSGVPSYANEGADACCIIVINTRTMCRESIVWLSDVGLTNGSDNTYEPEGVFVWKNELYVAYRKFIEKIVKN